MTAKLAAADMPSWPAAMSRQMAAAYCDLSVDTFDASCPVRPIAITPSRAGRRYLKIRLDEWLLSLDTSDPAPRQGMGAFRIAKREAQRA